MDLQLGYIVTLLTALLTSGVVMILIENLHLYSTLSDRFYNKMSPFMHKFTCYVRFVGKFSYGLKYKDMSMEYVKNLKDILGCITQLNTLDIVGGKDLKMSKFTAKSLDEFCEYKINNIWYYMSEKYTQVIPYIDYRTRLTGNDEYIKEQLRGISDRYESLKIDLSLLSRVSGDFYTDVYLPISTVYSEYEFWKKESTKHIRLTLILLVFTILSILMIIFMKNVLSFPMYASMTLICSFFFVYLVYKIVQIYMNSDKLFQ